MKQILLFLCLLQCLVTIAQTETLVTTNGKKVTFKPAIVNNADNGLTLTDKNIKLGGVLNKATTITASSFNTLAINGLQNGNITTNNVVVTDANGVLKTVPASTLSTPEPWYNIADNSPATANTQNIYQMGNIGIGQNAATTKLDVKNNTAGAIQIQDGTEKQNYVLTSDDNGVGTWTRNNLPATVIVGSLPNRAYDLGKNDYIGCSIKLNKGNWAIYTGLVINPLYGSSITSNANKALSPRFYISSSASSYTTSGFSHIDANSIIKGITGVGPNPVGNIMFINGCIRISVNSDNFTVYLFDANSTGSSMSINNTDPENFFYAMKVI